MTLAESILSRVMGRPVTAGEVIEPEPDLITVHDWYVVNFDDALRKLGVQRVHAPQRVLISTDHEPVALSAAAVTRQRKVREIVARHGITRFFDAGRGGHGHVFPVEHGLIAPGMFVYAYDPHVTNYGAVGCLGVPVVVEISEVLACGSVWMRVPQSVRVDLHGRLAPGVTARDVAQRLIVDLGADQVDYACVEFGGPALPHLSLGERMTFCNTPIEIGAKSALFETDERIESWLAQRLDPALGALQPQRAGPGAVYRARVRCDVDLAEPQVAAPPTPDNVVGVSAVAGIEVDHAFIGSCANSSLEDLRGAAALLRGRRIAARVRLLITPGTQQIAAAAAAEGLLQVFIEAGASLTAPGCGPCAGGRIGPLAEGEVSINTGTRNDYGRLGAREAQIYLASPLTVAASAITGRITDPRELAPVPAVQG